MKNQLNKITKNIILPLVVAGGLAFSKNSFGQTKVDSPILDSLNKELLFFKEELKKEKRKYAIAIPQENLKDFNSLNKQFYGDFVNFMRDNGGKTSYLNSLNHNYFCQFGGHSYNVNYHLTLNKDNKKSTLIKRIELEKGLSCSEGRGTAILEREKFLDNEANGFNEDELDKYSQVEDNLALVTYEFSEFSPKLQLKKTEEYTNDIIKIMQAANYKEYQVK